MRPTRHIPFRQLVNGKLQSPRPLFNVPHICVPLQALKKLHLCQGSAVVGDGRGRPQPAHLAPLQQQQPYPLFDFHLHKLARLPRLARVVFHVPIADYDQEVCVRVRDHIDEVLGFDPQILLRIDARDLALELCLVAQVGVVVVVEEEEEECARVRKEGSGGRGGGGVSPNLGRGGPGWRCQKGGARSP